MKKYYNILILFLLLSSIMKAQISPTIVVEDKNHSNGVHNYCSHGCLISPSSPSNPVNITNTAQVTYTAGNCIQLLPGFSTNSLSGTGFFKAKIQVQDFPVYVLAPATTPTTQVGKFEKLELGLDLPNTIDNLVDAYFINRSDPTAVNPFDPDDINIVATFTSPSGNHNRIIFGFYMDDYVYGQSGQTMTWEANNTPYNHFRVRFAPTEEGQWDCQIRVFSPNNKFPNYLVSCIGFTCISSANKGYLEVGHHKRQLRFSGTQESFFAIGQNIEWIYQGTTFWNKDEFYPNAFIAHRNWVKNIADYGGNFARVVMASNSHGFEWEYLGDYSGYPAQYYWSGNIFVDSSKPRQSRQHNAYEVDKLLDLCEQNNVYLDMCLEMHTGWADPAREEDIWNFYNNPYHLSLGLASPLDALTDVDAKKYFKRKLRYFFSRWGYSTSVAVLELLSEQDKWYNYLTDASAAVNSYNWHAEMINYIKNGLGEQNHMISTSYADRHGIVYALNSVDVTSGHKYGQSKKINHERYEYLYENCAICPASSNPNGLLVDYNKPSIFGELGIGEDGADPGDIEGCDDVEFHNSLWSTAFMGCYGAGLNWWQTANSTYRQNNYPALKLFFHGIDFETNDFTYAQKWKEVTIPPKNYNMEVFALRNFNKEKVMGWVHVASYWWGNISQNCQDHNGNFLHLPPDDDSYNSPFLPPPQQFKVDHLKMLKKYDIDWYSTRVPINTPLLTGSRWTNIFGTLKPYFPLLGGPDYAFQAYRHGTTFRGNDADFAPVSDTLFCGEDTIHVNGTYEDDINGAYSYFWNFGNGQTSNLAHPTVIYPEVGTYNVQLIVIDTLGHIDTLEQQIVVVNCEEQQRLGNIANNLDNVVDERTKNILVYPNPSFDVFNVSFNIEKNSVNNYGVEIYNGNGVLIQKNNFNEKDFIINLKGFPAGVYLVKFITEKDIYYKKIILH